MTFDQDLFKFKNMENTVTLVTFDADTNIVEASQMRVGDFYRVESSPDPNMVRGLAVRIDVGLVSVWYYIGDRRTFATMLIEACSDVRFVRLHNFSFVHASVVS